MSHELGIRVKGQGVGGHPRRKGGAETKDGDTPTFRGHRRRRRGYLERTDWCGFHKPRREPFRKEAHGVHTDH